MISVCLNYSRYPQLNHSCLKILHGQLSTDNVYTVSVFMDFRRVLRGNVTPVKLSISELTY